MATENIRLNSKDGQTESWEKTIKDGNMTKCIRVEKVENGYIVSYNEYGRKSEKAEYTNITKKWISTSNPLEEKEDKKESKKVESKPNIDAKILSFIQGSSLNF